MTWPTKGASTISLVIFNPTMPIASPRQVTRLAKHLPLAPDTLYWVPAETGGADVRWPSAGEFHNSAPPLLGPKEVNHFL